VAIALLVPQILDVAARGGKWKPDLLLIHSSLTPWMLEMALALPNPLFYACFYFLRLLPEGALMSPGQLDIVEGRKSMVDWHFAELVQVRVSCLCICTCFDALLRLSRSRRRWYSLIFIYDYQHRMARLFSPFSLLFEIASCHYICAVAVDPGDFIALETSDIKPAPHGYSFATHVTSQAGERHQYDAPVCSLVLRQLRSIENTLFPDLADAAKAAKASVEGSDISGTGDAVHHIPGPPMHSSVSPSVSRYGGSAVYNSSPSRKTVVASGNIAVSYNNTDHMTALMAALLDVEGATAGKSVVDGHPTLGEWWYWISRCFAVVASIGLVLFMFLHDY
jgi:hypothetical protein